MDWAGFGIVIAQFVLPTLDPCYDRGSTLFEENLFSERRGLLNPKSSRHHSFCAKIIFCAPRPWEGLFIGYIALSVSSKVIVWMTLVFVKRFASKEPQKKQWLHIYTLVSPRARSVPGLVGVIGGHSFVTQDTLCMILDWVRVFVFVLRVSCYFPARPADPPLAFRSRRRSR